MVAMDPDGLIAQGLRQAHIARAPTYSTGQVARIIGVSPETVRRLVDAYEPPAIRANAQPRRGPSGLRAIRIVSHRRIPHDALVDWIRENAAYVRLNRDAD
jgi:Helix-turn-helix domain